MKKRRLLPDQSEFFKMMDTVLEESIAKHAKLLLRNTWSMDDSCKEEIMEAVGNLARRFIYRASLFAMHRSGTHTLEAFKKRKIGMDVDDLEMAWKTLESL